MLRRYRPGTRWWVWLTAIGWLLGLAVFMVVASPLWQPGQPLWLTVAIGLLAGVLMAGTVAAVTGSGVLRLAELPARHRVAASNVA